MKKSAALFLDGRLRRLSVSTISCDLFSSSDVGSLRRDVIFGVLIPVRGVRDLLGDGVAIIFNFCVANLLAAGDIVASLSIFD